MDRFAHSKQNQLQSDVRRVRPRDKIDQFPSSFTFPRVGGELGDSLAVVIIIDVAIGPAGSQYIYMGKGRACAYMH